MYAENGCVYGSVLRYRRLEDRSQNPYQKYLVSNHRCRQGKGYLYIFYCVASHRLLLIHFYQYRQCLEEKLFRGRTVTDAVW